MNSLFCNEKHAEFPGKCLSQTNAQYNPLNVRAESTCSKGLEIPCQNTFKDKSAFIKRLIKVPVARNLFLLHSSSCKTTDSSESHYVWTKVSPMNLLQHMTQEIQFLVFMGGSNVLQAFPNYLICLRFSFIRICTARSVCVALACSSWYCRSNAWLTYQCQWIAGVYFLPEVKQVS